ncbi:MAG: hypothetical protein JO174_00050 [Herbaspirillum sp.]|nr:hypothetical protein [Herbaspirillum sp.]
MSINSVSSSHNSTAHASMPPVPKKPAVNFTDVLNAAGQPAQASAASSTSTNTSSSATSQTGKA